jgi:Receptor L domain
VFSQANKSTIGIKRRPFFLLTFAENFVRELEENLNSIQEIDDYLKIVRTSPIVSLNFLKNLTIIHGKKLEQDK